MRPAPLSPPDGYRLVTLESTGSTNDDAVRAARDGDPGLLWIVARQQVAGRGRHGRQWTSPPGNLYASLLLVEPCEPARAPQLGFVAGVALHEAAEAVTGVGAPGLALKWPNDLLLQGAKVAGLLLEGHRIGPSGTFAVVIGFGVNVASAPAGTPYPTSTLGSVRPDMTAEALFQALSRSFAGTFSAWAVAARSGGSGSFAAVRRLWLERAAGLHREVTLRLPAGERQGVFEDLDAEGRLLLKTSAGVEPIDAGDLYFPNLLDKKAGSHAGPVRS